MMPSAVAPTAPVVQAWSAAAGAAAEGVGGGEPEDGEQVSF
jgi:hypothetical protein